MKISNEIADTVDKLRDEYGMEDNASVVVTAVKLLKAFSEKTKHGNECYFHDKAVDSWTKYSMKKI
jgi:hypothetical protein